jgi:hypothetical protein
VWSGVIDDALRKFCCFEGACIDFAFVDRAAFGIRGTSPPGLGLFESVPRRLPWLKEGVRPMRPPGVSLYILGTSLLTLRVSRPVGNMPGPTDLRGARAAGFGGGCDGNWLWRRVRMGMVAGGGGIDEDSGGGLIAAALVCFADWLNRRIKDELRAGRVSVPVPGVNASGPIFVRGAALVTGAVVGRMPTPPPPGAGKSLRLGS